MSDHRPLRGLRGERVYLRPLEPEDAETVHRWYEDTRVQTLMGDPPRSLAFRRQRYDAAAKEDGADVFRFMICRLDDDRPVGRVDLFEIDRQNGSAAFGITIGDPADWGQGMGSDAINALVDFAFGQLRLERVWLDTSHDNTRAQTTYERCGFVREGVLRHSWFQDGEWLDDIRMALLREEWLALPRKRSWDLVADAAAKPSASGT
jgi:RimJ/RimL family protein N-acetyltransferase